MGMPHRVTRFLSAGVAVLLFATSAWAWPETCEQGETFTDPETGNQCVSTGTTVVLEGIEFCMCDCDGTNKLFSMGEN